MTEVEGEHAGIDAPGKWRAGNRRHDRGAIRKRRQPTGEVKIEVVHIGVGVEIDRPASETAIDELDQHEHPVEGGMPREIAALDADIALIREVVPTTIFDHGS